MTWESSRYNIYSSLDLKRAYLQVNSRVEDKAYTMFKQMANYFSFVEFHLESKTVYLASSE